MIYKIILGIVLPVLLIVSLAVVASYGEVSENRVFLKEISVQKIISEERGLKNSIKIGDIQLQNDFLLSKRHSMPMLGACLIDTEGEKQNIEIGTVDFSEGEYVYEYENVYRTDSYTSVEIKSKETKKVYVYLVPNYYYGKENYSELLTKYKGYDTVIIYEKKTKSRGYEYYDRYDYVSCNNLNENDKNKATKIKLIP